MSEQNRFLRWADRREVHAKELPHRSIEAFLLNAAGELLIQRRHREKLTFPSFWRPNQVPVRVGNRTESGFHLLQLWTRHQERAEEVLVIYPADGYWRARPLPPKNLRWSAYGSSFLIGPVEAESRPFVDIRDIAFDPATRTFTLNFARGGSATLRLDMKFAPPTGADSGTPSSLPCASFASACQCATATPGVWPTIHGKAQEQTLKSGVLSARIAASETWRDRT